MTKSLRDIRQEEFADLYCNSHKFGILNLCPRFGKCKVAILALKKLNNPKVLIAYPHLKIKNSWEDEFKKMKYPMTNITFSTHASLRKHENNKFDVVILDEIHLLSEKQIESVQKMMLTNKHILGLTGTLSSWTERTLNKSLGIKVLAVYSMDKAIEEKIISDYHITVKLVELDNKIKNKYSKSIRTEKEQFDAYGMVINKLEVEKKETFFLKLARMRVIQNSIAKIKATKEILSKFSEERVLVFCGLKKVAESLGCPVFHSTTGDKTIFEDFAKGNGNHMAVVKIGNTGSTYKPLSKVVINYFDSNSENLAQKINRCMAIEYDTPDKKADIWIVCTKEHVEQRWLSTALEFFDEKKITYLN